MVKRLVAVTSGGAPDICLNIIRGLGQLALESTPMETPQIPSTQLPHNSMFIVAPKGLSGRASFTGNEPLGFCPAV